VKTIYQDANLRIEYLDYGTYRFHLLSAYPQILEFLESGLAYPGPVITIDLPPYTIFTLVHGYDIYKMCTMHNTAEKIA
jgi:hypothetical protein